MKPAFGLTLVLGLTMLAFTSGVGNPVSHPVPLPAPGPLGQPHPLPRPGSVRVVHARIGTANGPVAAHAVVWVYIGLQRVASGSTDAQGNFSASVPAGHGFIGIHTPDGRWVWVSDFAMTAGRAQTFTNPVLKPNPRH